MADKVRVLIVDDVAETRENVRKLLQFEADIEVVGAARTGREAIQLSDELKPDVVLMDINMPDMDGISATEAIRARQPIVQIVILSVQGDPNYMRRAMLAGARDFLTKPPMADEMISAVRRAGTMAREERAKSAQALSAPTTGPAHGYMPGIPLKQGHMIMTYSPKGGTGVTTLAVNLALTLNNDETRTVLVDGNLQFGDVAVFLNEQGKNNILDLAPRADELDPDIVEEVLLKHATSGMRVLAAPSRPEHAEKVNSAQFSKLLSYLRQIYAYVVVDTTPTLNDITLSILDITDLLLLVITQDIPAIKNARLFLDLLNTLGVQRDKVCLVMNRYDKRIAITPDRVGENLKQPVAAVIPLDERVVIPAVNRGIPFVLDNKSQPSARAIFSLAESIKTQIAKLESGEYEKPARK
jgi:pilus assembly protein CpaE